MPKTNYYILTITKYENEGDEGEVVFEINDEVNSSIDDQTACISLLKTGLDGCTNED